MRESKITFPPFAIFLVLLLIAFIIICVIQDPKNPDKAVVKAMNIYESKSEKWNWTVNRPIDDDQDVIA